MSLDFVRIISEHVDRENSTAQLEYLCPWTDRLTESANLVGGLQYDNSGNPSYSAPQEYPYGTGLFCNNIDITPSGDFDRQNGGYLNAHLIVSYAALNILNPYATDGIQICQISTSVSAEMIPLPSGKYKWETSGVTLDDNNDVKPALVAPYVEMNVKVLFAAKPLLSDMTGLTGQVNDDTLDVTSEDTFDENLVLFLGGETEQIVNCQGKPAWVRNLKFGIRDNDGLGWQALWSPDDQAYDNIVNIDTGDHPYVQGDFTPLFAIS